MQVFGIQQHVHSIFLELNYTNLQTNNRLPPPYYILVKAAMQKSFAEPQKLDFQLTASYKKMR